MDLFKKMFVGLGWVAGFFCYTMTALIVSSSRGRRKKRGSRRHRSSGFWKMLERMIVYNWFYEGVRKSRTRVETAYFRRTGCSLWQEPDEMPRAAQSAASRTAGTTSTAASGPKTQTSGRTPRPSPETNRAPKPKATPENERKHTAAPAAPASAVRRTQKKKAQPARPCAEPVAAKVPEPENVPEQKTPQQVEAERQLRMKDLRVALLDEVRAVHAAPPETAADADEQGAPEQQLRLLLYQPDLPQAELETVLGRLRAERIRQQATYQGAPFADVFPVSLILANEDSERACIVDVGEKGLSYVIPWASIPAELREILKRYVSQADGKLLGYCKEELCNIATNRMIVELYLGKQEGLESRFLF